jgi:hypothetical protein
MPALMSAVCVALVRELYASWRTRRATGVAGSEPNLTVAFVRAYLAQAESVDGVRVPQAFKDECYSRQSYMVRVGLEAAVRRGALERSTGCGARRRQAAVYVPADVAASYVFGQCRECLAINKHERICSKNTAPWRFDVGD